MNRHIPLIISEGTPFERGLHLGRAAREHVLHTVRSYMVIFRAAAGLRHKGVLAQAERFLPVIADYAPSLLDEMRGIAEGAGCDLREIVAVNARTELMYGITNRHECTAVAVSGPASADGHVRLAQNWDWHPSLAGSLVLWAVQRNKGQHVLTLTEAGIVGKVGINSAGLAMCINLLLSDEDYAGPAVPMHVILRHILDEASSINDALNVIAQTERCTSCNHLFADHAGEIADVEATPMGHAVERTRNGVLVHANHCHGRHLVAGDRYVRDYPESLDRDARMQSMVGEGSINEARLQAIFADHANSPNTICHHPDKQGSFVEQSESIASIIFDLTAGTLDLSDGPPCEYPYQRYAIAAYL